ncbi:hypothetical protein [Croceiramulus getboli]|nr:hypothetical protein P8624_06215 [Flavobacteriaceae bacterium YJPT1-3]
MNRTSKIAFIGLLGVSTLGMAQVEKVENAEVDTAPTVTSLAEYSQIDRAKLPQAVKEAVADAYAEMTIAQAFKTPADSYKIVLVAQDQRSTKTVYATADGKWIKEDDGQ